MMELNKYDIVEWFALNLRGVVCEDCPIRKECIKGEHVKYICFNEDDTRELLIKKYNL